MKKRLLTHSFRALAFTFFGFTAAMLSPSVVSAQCSFMNNQYPGGDVTGPAAVGQTVTVNSCSYAGEFASVTGFQANNLYTVAISGLATGYITVFDASNAAVAWGPSPLSFVPPASGNYKTQWTTSGPSACGTDNTCHTTTVAFTAAPPAAPPTPTQDPAPPTCTSGTSLSIAGSPAAGTQWYWQTSATGTSTATPYSGAYNVMNNGTYYVRAYDSGSTLWSTAASFTVSNFPTATPPPAPVADVNPSCAPTGTVLTEAAAPAGYVYYWQGTVNGGVSTALDASTPYNVTTTGTYYVSAYETATQCWSNTVGIAVAVDSYTPPAPVATQDPVNACLNSPSVSVGAMPGATSGTQTVTFGTNYTLAPGAASLNGTLSLPTGATITSSVLTFNGITTGPSQYLSDMSFTLTGASTYGNTTFPGAGATNAGPFNYNTTTNPAGGAVTLNMNNSWFQAATFQTITLTVNYTLPTPSITWYDAATGGTILGTGSPLEAVGTSVLPNTATEGSYLFYAAATVGGCTSSTIPVTVNITPVLAELAPVDVTCNGGNNGSFTLGTVTCGTPPFVYSVNNGPYGAIPADLEAGTYIVTIQDASMEVSAPITVVVEEPTAPTGLMVNTVNYFSAEVTWTPEGDELEWLIEYGPAGFTPGTGMLDTATSNTWTIEGLTEDTEYEFYVTAMCSTLGEAAGPESFTTNAGFFTYDNSCGPGFIDISGTGTPLNLTDDQTTVVTSSFPISFQGETDDQITISNNGWITFASAGFDVFSQDLDDEEGNVYYETVNVGGTNYFVVQWDNRPRYPGVVGQSATFEIAINETTGEIYYIYDDVVFGGTQSFADYGDDAYIAAAGAIESIEVSAYDATYLQNNSCIHFYNALCPNAQNVSMLLYPDDAILDWDAGLYGETEWTIVYGLAGFDPANSSEWLGTQTGLMSSDASFGQTLQQLTEYDVYIYSECQADDLTSGGLLVNFTTLPLCSNPFDISGMTLVDTLDLAWDWTETPGYPVSGFNVQYGMTGFELYSNDATEEPTNAIDFFHTVDDAGLLAGGVYDVYVQAACQNGDTSSFIGPITLVMPLSNDSVCGAEMLAADGTVYTFNNSGATVEIDESSIAPPAEGAQVTTGWTNSTLNNTTWFTFVAPATGSVRIDNTAIGYNGQAAVYAASDCGNFGTFNLEAANDNEIDGLSLAPNYTICGLTPGTTYYLMHDGFNGTTGNYSISVTPIVLEAGTAAPVTDVCSGGDIELFNTVNGEDAGGVWSSSIAAVNASISGSEFSSEGLAYTVFNFQYRVTDGCAYDSIMTQVHVFAPSNAGNDGVITACRNEPIDLLSGLNGSADLTGTWYDPTNTAMPSSGITTSNIPGQFNYDYIAGNGVCPNDTANVVVNVLANCNWLDIQEEVFSGVSLYPNPSEGTIFITSDVTEAFDYVVTDAKGSVIAKADGAIKAQTNQIDLNGAETGVYFIRLSNAQAQKVFRVVIR